MQDKAEQLEVAEWAGQLKKELEKRSGRKDVEVGVYAVGSYKATIVAGANGHPVINVNSTIQQNPQELASTLDYLSEQLQNWELTKIIHKKAAEDCAPVLEKLKVEFPHIALNYNIIDSGKHSIWVAKEGDKTYGHFDLWSGMSSGDVKRIIVCIKELEDTLDREGCTYAEMTYWWK